MSFRTCKKCKCKMQLIITEEVGKISFYPLDRFNYCNDCWEKKEASKNG